MYWYNGAGKEAALEFDPAVLTASFMPWLWGLSWERRPPGPSGGWESWGPWIKSFIGGPPPPPTPPPEGFP